MPPVAIAYRAPATASPTGQPTRPAYEAGLRRRGDLTLWLDEAAVAGWSAAKRCTPGGQPIYSDLAIELVLTLRLVFHLALRQVEAFAGSILRLLGLELSVPDHSSLSRRGRAFCRPVSAGAAESRPDPPCVGQRGLELFGQGEWNAVKHGRTRRSWRKLHLAVDVGSGEIAAHMLINGSDDDAAQVPLLLRGVEGHIALVTADGAYDGGREGSRRPSTAWHAGSLPTRPLQTGSANHR